MFILRTRPMWNTTDTYDRTTELSLIINSALWEWQQNAVSLKENQCNFLEGWAATDFYWGRALDLNLNEVFLQRKGHTVRQPPGKCRVWVKPYIVSLEAYRWNRAVCSCRHCSASCFRQCCQTPSGTRMQASASVLTTLLYGQFINAMPGSWTTSIPQVWGNSLA